jgi:hypothetical protein
MNHNVKYILAVMPVDILGGALNKLIITISGKIIPPLEGADLSTMGGLGTSICFMKPNHFLIPFLSNVIGKILAAFLVVNWINKYQQKFAIGIGLWFLIIGIINLYLLPSPLWFTVADLTLGNFPKVL